MLVLFPVSAVIHCTSFYQVLGYSLHMKWGGETVYKKMVTASSSSMASKDTGMMMVSKPKPVGVHQLKCTQSNQVIELHETPNNGYLEDYFKFAAYNKLEATADVATHSQVY
nr:hypothetical protein [Tanacetum cinerariifolium]